MLLPPPNHHLLRHARALFLKGVLCVFTALLLAGCQGSDGTQPIKAQSNIIAGRVTMEDGSPLRGDIKDVVIGISGVSGLGERVSYTPIVKDGTYRQKVAGGQYSFSTSLFCYVLDLHQGAEFQLPLEHVGSHWNKNRDADEGIVQDFILKYTGPERSPVAVPL